MATFRKRGNKWEYRISYKDPFTQKNKLKSKSGFSTKKEAQRAASEMEKQLSEGLEFTEDIPLKNFLNDWLYEYKKPVLRKNTFQLHKQNIENHINPYFKNIPLKKITPLMYQKFLNHLADQGYSKRTIEIIHGTIFGALSKAVSLGKITKNPSEGSTIPTVETKRKSDDLEYMKTEDIPLFLKTAYKYNYIYWIFFKVLIETGMRKGEAAALQWSDIDLEEGTIYIRKTLDFSAKGEEELLGETKTFKSKRKITISQSLIKNLTFHIQWQDQNKATLKDTYNYELNLVLCRPNGDFMPKSSLFNAFSRILKQAKLPRLPIHSLRHTHAVLLLEAGADMKYIQERLGHGSMQITADVYSHISKKIESETMNKYENYMKGILD